MKRHDHLDDETWEHDAVWNLLDQSPPATPSTRFLDDTVRAARMEGIALPWWKCLGPNVGFTAIATTAAAVVLGFILLNSQPTDTSPSAAESHHAAEIQEIAETETLIAAMDHMDEFSDTELVSLIGF